MDRVRAEWLTNTATTAALCLFAALALGFTTALAIRRWHSEQIVLRKLSENRDELRGEIARREAAEAGLLQAQRLEALGRLTGGVAHDFNNLLTAILGTVHLLERHLGAAADERARKYLGMARDAVQRGAKLNASLLAFARRQKLHTASIDANELVQGFTPLIQRALGEAVSLAVVLDPELPPCRADASQLEAALLNLAINARDALPRGGTVTLTTRPARLDAALLAGNADAEARAPMSRSRCATTASACRPRCASAPSSPSSPPSPQGKGTGLGLSQVFGFIRQLGGHIAIDSSPGRGHRRDPVSAHGGEPPAQAPGPRRRRCRRASSPSPAPRCWWWRTTSGSARSPPRRCAMPGFRVIAAQDALEALALLRRGEQFDVLFSDIVMPGGMNGIELAQAARRLRPRPAGAAGDRLCRHRGRLGRPRLRGDVEALRPVRPDPRIAELAADRLRGVG